MTEYLNREQSAADRANHGVNGIPRGVDPWNFIGEKFEKIENASDCDNRRVTQYFERLVLRCKRDPVEMDGQSGDKNREIKVDAGQARQAERDCKEIELFHGGIIRQG
jgi:Txe/YoeB family toxin of Txe-Axe toxin-antitoxin module